MRKCWAPICLAGALQEVIWIASYAIGPFREHTGLFLVFMIGSFLLCLWSFVKIPISNQAAALAILGFGLLFRLTALPAPPYQSEDVYRYIWDARVASKGINPFHFPPNAPELEKLRDSSIYPMINSKPYITAYPPLSQVLFHASYTIFGESVLAMKAVFSLFEFCSLLLVWRMLVLLRHNLQPLYLMAWNPFFIFEFSHSGHSESAMIFLLMLSLYLMYHQRHASALASFAGAVLSKLHPALWFPLYLRRLGWKATLPGITAGAALALFYFDWGGALKYIISLRLYYRLFEFNAGIHYLLRLVGQVFFHQAWDKVTGPYLAALLVGLTILICRKFPLRDIRDLLHAGFWIMTADLCLSTTVHPWYLSWAALALPFFPYAFMLYWTGVVFLSYLAYAYHPVYEPLWVLIVEYVPMYALMAWEIYRGGPLLANCARAGDCSSGKFLTSR
jgi:alpha-1,6-mannosyltransferase